MSIITRKELVSKYKIATKKLDEIKNKKYEYKTNRSCDQYGMAANMSINDVVLAGAIIHASDANIEQRIKDYGILPEDLKNGSARKFNGFSIDDWDHDFKLRVEQIHNEKKLKTYETVIEKLVRNFSEDDKFLIEMGEIDALDVDLDDDTPVEETADTEESL